MRSCADVVGAITLAVWSTACASTGAVPRPFPGSPRTGVTSPPPATPDRPPRAPSTRGIDAYALVGTALDLRGVRYRNRGADPDGFDCSGFTQYVFGQHGLKLPRNVKDQFSTGTSVQSSDLQEGYLVFFTTGSSGASHVGIAVGGDRFVHAPSSTGVVRVERLAARYWAERFVGARRFSQVQSRDRVP